MKKSKLSLAALSTFLLVLSACGGSNNTSNNTSSISSNIGNSSTPESSLASSNEPDSSSVNSTSSSSSSVAPSSSSSSSVAQDFNVTVGENTYVTVSVSGGTKHKEGSQVSFRITPRNSNVRVDSVKVTYGSNKEVTVTNAGDTYTFTMPSADVEIKITAHEEQAKYTITLPTDKDVEVKVDNNVTSCVAGTNIIFSVTCKNNEKQIGEVTVKDAKGNPVGVNNGGDGRYAFAMPESNVTINVTLVARKYKYTLKNNENVYFSVMGNNEEWEAGSEFMFSASGKPGYFLRNVIVKGAATGNTVQVTKGQSTYTLTMPKEDIVLDFDVAQMYTVTSTTDGHATVTINNAKDYYNEGEEVTFKVALEDQFEIESLNIKYGSTTVSYTENAGNYKFNMPKGNAVINVITKAKSNPGSSSDPFTTFTAFEGDWTYYDGYYDYLMRLRVVFHGNGTLSYCLTYDDISEEYWTYTDLKEVTILPSNRGSIPSFMSDMQGSHRDDDTEVVYTYDEATDRVSANLKYNMSQKMIDFQIIRSGSNITAIKPLQDLYTGFHQIGNRMLYKI